MRTFLFCVCALLSSSAFADGHAYGSCYVQNGEAHALVCAQGSFSGSGTGYVYAYDANGSEVDRSMHTWVAVVINGCEDVGSVSVSGDAVSCAFRP